LSLYAKQNATGQTLCLETNVKTTGLLDEVFEDLDTCCGFSDGVIIAIIFRTPDEIQRGTERLVSPRQGCVDDEFPVPANRDESTVGGVEEGLGINFAGSEIFRWEGNRVVVFQGSICTKSALRII
jgi:hypothetical protein